MFELLGTIFFDFISISFLSIKRKEKKRTRIEIQIYPEEFFVKGYFILVFPT